MELLSEKYGWTPNQIREMEADDVYAYLEILRTKAAIEKTRRMRERP